MNLTNQKVSMSKHTLNQTSAAKQTTHSVGSFSNYASNRPASLSEGQIIRGEVTDLRNNEVSITLENNTKVTGFIENAASLSIGQPAAFKVVSIAPEGIILEALPTSYSNSEQITIRKALEEAGLPQNEKNKLIVHELLKNNLSINKQSIQNILQQAFHHKDISISTLVLINKLHLPLTQELATQFENYRNYEHRLIQELDSITDSLPALLEQLAKENPASDVTVFGQHLFSLLLNHQDSSSPSVDPILMFSSPEEKEEFMNILSNFPVEESFIDDLSNNNATVRTTADIIYSCMDVAEEVDLKNMEEALLSLEDTLDTESNPELLSLETFEIPKAMEQLERPVVQTILEQLQTIQKEQNELASFFSPQERDELLNLLKDIPIPSELREKISSGEATVSEVLIALKNVLPFSNPNEVATLVQSPHFKTTLKETLLSNWTLTPKQLLQEQPIKELYQTLYEQITDIHTLMKTALSGPEAMALSNHAEHAKQNIDFMQTLNQIFPYMQIPLKLKDKYIHSELYVYTKKKNLKEHPEQISVLLHLDMDSLGPLDIHITLHQNQVSTKFYMATKEAKELVSMNIEQLETNLNEKGFLLQSEILDRSRNIDIVEDFITRDIPNSSMKRFTFDIRA